MASPILADVKENESTIQPAPVIVTAQDQASPVFAAITENEEAVPKTDNIIVTA
jgi:hypothetical protein